MWHVCSQFHFYSDHFESFWVHQLHISSTKAGSACPTQENMVSNILQVLCFQFYSIYCNIYVLSLLEASGTSGALVTTGSTRTWTHLWLLPQLLVINRPWLKIIILRILSFLFACFLFSSVQDCSGHLKQPLPSRLLQRSPFPSPPLCWKTKAVFSWRPTSCLTPTVADSFISPSRRFDHLWTDQWIASHAETCVFRSSLWAIRSRNLCSWFLLHRLVCTCSQYNSPGMHR